MKKRCFTLLIILAISVCCLSTIQAAADDTAIAVGTKSSSHAVLPITPRAVNSFQIDIPAGEIAAADTSFSLAAGEIVTINAVYDPASASVDAGLIAPDGLFYSLPASDGQIKVSIKVNMRGKYTLAIRNNSDEDISVSGFVNY